MLKQIAAACLLLGAVLCQDVAASPNSFDAVQNHSPAVEDPSVQEILLQKAAAHWNLSLEEAVIAHQNGVLTFSQIDTKTYLANYDGGILELVIDSI